MRRLVVLTCVSILATGCRKEMAGTGASGGSGGASAGGANAGGIGGRAQAGAGGSATGGTRAGGSGPERVLKVNVYIVGIEHWPAFNRVYAELFGDAKPARAVVPVPELHFGYLVEVDAIAAR